jgi:ornithine carbamoyltransferase
MQTNLKNRSLLTLFDFSTAEIHYLLKLSIALKRKKQCGKKGRALLGKNIVLIFNKPSTRTRCAFETAVFDESGCVTVLENSHIGYKESIEDTAKVLSQFYDGIGFRGNHCAMKLLAKHAEIPLWNCLTEQHHPTQALADLMTITEYINKPLHRVKVVYVGDGRNNVARSWMIAAAKMGMHLVNLAPEALWPDKVFIRKIKTIAQTTQAHIQCEHHISRALVHADVIYTDVWVSMGEEKYWEDRIQLLKFYQVNVKMLAATRNPQVIFMHCLPALHDFKTQLAQTLQKKFGLKNMEVSDEVFRSPHSVVFEQAQNRLHTLKALLVASIV